jgi:hypothetical protein
LVTLCRITRTTMSVHGRETGASYFYRKNGADREVAAETEGPL